jgi:hypothetical protein
MCDVLVAWSVCRPSIFWVCVCVLVFLFVRFWPCAFFSSPIDTKIRSCPAYLRKKCVYICCEFCMVWHLLSLNKSQFHPIRCEISGCGLVTNICDYTNLFCPSYLANTQDFYISLCLQDMGYSAQSWVWWAASGLSHSLCRHATAFFFLGGGGG